MYAVHLTLAARTNPLFTWRNQGNLQPFSPLYSARMQKFDRRQEMFVWNHLGILRLKCHGQYLWNVHQQCWSVTALLQANIWPRQNFKILKLTSTTLAARHIFCIGVGIAGQGLPSFKSTSGPNICEGQWNPSYILVVTNHHWQTWRGRPPHWPQSGLGQSTRSMTVAIQVPGTHQGLELH